MTPRRVNLRESPIEKLGYALRDHRAVIGLVLTFLALAGLIAAALGWIEREYALPPAQEEGEIVRFGEGGSRYRPGETLFVVVRMEGGGLQTLSASSARLAHCRIGDRIRLVRHGRILHVRRRPCTPPARAS